MLIVLRALMGVTEGSFCPTSFAATAEASKPTRRGFNLGVQQSAFPLFGLALGPIIATQMLRFMDWRWVFIVVAVPGLILGILIWRVIRDPVTVGTHAQVQRAPLRDMLKHPNVPLGMLGLMCAMVGIFVLSAMAPNYLVDYLKLSVQQMGFVTSAIGFGGFLGQVVLPGLSDVIGRKTVAILRLRARRGVPVRIQAGRARTRCCCSCCCSRARSSASACSGSSRARSPPRPRRAD